MAVKINDVVFWHNIVLWLNIGIWEESTALSALKMEGIIFLWCWYLPMRLRGVTAHWSIAWMMCDCILGHYFIWQLVSLLSDHFMWWQVALLSTQSQFFMCWCQHILVQCIAVNVGSLFCVTNIVCHILSACFSCWYSPLIRSWCSSGRKWHNNNFQRK